MPSIAASSELHDHCREVSLSGRRSDAMLWARGLGRVQTTPKQAKIALHTVASQEEASQEAHRSGHTFCTVFFGRCMVFGWALCG